MLKVVLLASQLQGDDGTWPLIPLLDRLEARGFVPQIVCFSKGASLTDDSRVIEAPQLANRWLRSLAVRRLWNDSRGSRPDLVHALDDSMSGIALALAEIAQMPYVQTLNSFATLETGLRLSRRWSRGIVAGSHDVALDLVTQLGVPSGLISVILPGVVPPSPAPSDSGVKGVAVVGATGGAEDVGSFTILLDAAKLMLDAGHEAEFLIATGESLHVNLRHRAKKLGVAERVTVSDHSIVGARFWSLLDVYCQPSVGPSTGRSLLYALAHGLPAVATDVKGLRSLVEPGETALLIPPADPEALYHAILHLLRTPTMRSGSAARHASRSTPALIPTSKQTTWRPCIARSLRSAESDAVQEPETFRKA